MKCATVSNRKGGDGDRAMGRMGWKRREEKRKSKVNECDIYVHAFISSVCGMGMRRIPLPTSYTLTTSKKKNSITKLRSFRHLLVAIPNTIRKAIAVSLGILYP